MISESVQLVQFAAASGLFVFVAMVTLNLVGEFVIRFFSNVG